MFWLASCGLTLETDYVCVGLLRANSNGQQLERVTVEVNEKGLGFTDQAQVDRSQNIKHIDRTQLEGYGNFDQIRASWGSFETVL